MKETNMNEEKVERLIRELLKEIGEDPNREGLVRTPIRVAKALAYLTRGYQMKPHEVVNQAIFESGSDNMVVLRDIDVYSMCEHHMLPFFGHCHIGYISRGKVLGVSKIARIVDCLAARLQIQERLTMQIKDCIQKTLDPLGVMVVIEAQHMCMQMRGVEKQNSLTTTSDFTGFFQQAKTREEFMNLIKRNR